MSQILVWKSDTDNKLFESKAKYVTHLRSLAQTRAHQRKITKMNADRESFLVEMGNAVTSIKHLEEYIAEHWHWFFHNGEANALWKSDAKAATAHKLVAVSIDVRWSDEVSNSHSCPRNGVQNFNPRDDGSMGKPTSYPGWTGRIKFKVDAGATSHKTPRPLMGYGSDYFGNTPINTGSGGSGDGSSSAYDVKLFAADFPGMVRAREQAQVWSVLSNQDVIQEFA